MLNSIQRAMELDLPQVERAESCFWIASNYWERLKEIMKPGMFQNEKEEIDFFRNVKPQFTGRIEYFTILYEGLLFEPKDRDSALLFWNEEEKRLVRFRNKNETTISYYDSNDQYMDKEYFLRKNTDPEYILTARTYDADTRFRASQDTILASYLAYKMYNDFAAERIKDLVACPN